MQIHILARKLVALVVAAAALLIALPADAADGRWLRAESEHFIAYGEIPEPELRTAISELETLDAVLRWLTSIGPDDEAAKLEFYFVRSAGAIRIVAPEMDKNTLGVYSAAANAIAAVGLARDGGSYFPGQSQQVLFHEYAHHFMYRHFPGGYPAWYSEGFAEYISSVSFERNKVSIGKPPFNAVALVDNSWLAFDKLFTAKMSDLSKTERLKVYSSGWAAVHYMYGDSGRQKRLLQYLRLLRDGAPTDEAFVTSFGVTFEEMGAQLKRYVSHGIPYLSIEAAKFNVTSNVQFTRLPKSADDLLLPLLRLRKTGPISMEDAQANAEAASIRTAVYAEIKTKAAPLSGDPFADRVLAYNEVFLGEPMKAKPMLDAALARDGADQDALFLTGMMYLEEADRGGAQADKNRAEGRAYLGRLFKITDKHVPMLYYYARSFRTLSENTLNVLMRAQMLAPQVVEIDLTTASALIAMKRYEEASYILRPIVASPHGDGEAARQMLQSISAASGNASDRPSPP